MNSGLRTTRHLLTILALLLVSTFLGATPSGASPEQQAVPAAPYATDSILVRFKAGTPAAEKANAHAAVQGQVEREYSLVPGLEHLRIPADKVGVEQAIAILSRLPFVEYAEPNYLVQAVATPNDPSFDSLWGMKNINAPAAWEISTGSTNMVVADIDTGIDYTHPDLKANVWTNLDTTDACLNQHGYNFVAKDCDPADDQGHGTHTAGTLGAVGNNGVGVVGVNWNVKIMALKFLDSSGTGTNAGAIAALQYAVGKGVKVSNNSWGGGGYDQSMYNAIKAAGAAGHLFVAAAGNGNWAGIAQNNDKTPFYPASYNLDNIISVTAIDSSDRKASFANYGATSVDLGAPGVSILSTVPNKSYASYSGTSMATPHVAGSAALLWGLHPDWTYSQVKTQILSTARPISALSGKTVTGGTLDLAAAVGTLPPQPPSAPTNLVATAVSSSQVNLNWTDASTNEDGFKIERCAGAGCSNFAQIATVGANVTDYSNTGMAASTSYTYQVRAYNSGGNSDYSNTTSVTTPAAPAVPVAPSGLTATAVSTNQIDLAWTDKSTDEMGFRIERSADGVNFSQIYESAAGVTKYSDTSVTRNKKYYYRVYAYNANGFSPYSNTASAKTPRK